MSARQTWAVVHAERRALADELEGLTEREWATASLCAGWDVHDVLAHLVEGARTTRLGFVVAMARARLDFDRATADGLRRHRCTDPRDTLAAFRAGPATSTTSTPTSIPAPAARRARPIPATSRPCADAITASRPSPPGPTSAAPDGRYRWRSPTGHRYTVVPRPIGSTSCRARRSRRPR